MPVAKYQAIIVAGSATIYLTLRVKLRSKQKFPKKPHAREIAFRISSLLSSIYANGIFFEPPTTEDPEYPRHRHLTLQAIARY
jgi:hypothetical protein